MSAKSASFVAHRRERDVLRGLDAADDAPGVLLREEALGHDDEEIDVQADGGERDAAAVSRRWRSTQPQRCARTGAAARRRPARRADRRGRAALGRAADAGSCAHIIGVAVSETSRDTAMASVRVTANSRKSRPTIPPMRRIGMNTATSETLIESTVKPISRAPLQRGLQRRVALLEIAGDVLEHHDGVVDDEAGRDGERHQREVVEAVAEQVHARRTCRAATAARRRWESRWPTRCAGRRRRRGRRARWRAAA